MNKTQLLEVLTAFKNGNMSEQQIVDQACGRIRDNVAASKVQRDVARSFRALLIKQHLSENGLILWRQLANSDVSIPMRFFVGH